MQSLALLVFLVYVELEDEELKHVDPLFRVELQTHIRSSSRAEEHVDVPSLETWNGR